MKVLFVSLGCDKNTVDSEKILKRFVDKYDFDIALTEDDADVVIINTCSFILDAKTESINHIKHFVNLKRKKIIKKVFVLGCLVTENEKTHEYDDILKDVDVFLPAGKYIDGLSVYNDRVSDILSFSSSIKVSDGCDKYCSYCIIPYLRGRYKSAKPYSVISEAKKLAKSGVKELSIVSQDTLHYGFDLKDEKFRVKDRPIVDLVDAISKISGIEWIRLLYCYPEEVDDKVVNLIKNNKKVLPYIDMPIQHINDNILKKMNRHTTRADIVEMIKKLRSEVPDIAIRTTLMVGFPGEGEKEFRELLDFVKDAEFDKLGVFCYSRERLSKSYEYGGQVSEDIKKKRKKAILDVQKKIVEKKNKDRIGIVYNSIVEGRDTAKKDTYIVRPYFNARDIDDKVYVKSKELLLSGSFVNALITKSKGYDLVGEIV